MAIIIEEEEQQSPRSSENQIRKTKLHRPTLPPKDPKPQTQNPFAFWFYFTVTASLITLVFVSLSFLSSSQDPKSWFLSLPASLRQHYSNGRIIKVQTNPSQPPIEVFVTESGPFASENVMIVHGLGLSSYAFREMIRSLGSKGVHVIAIDLPGNGFSDRSTVATEEERATGVLVRFKEVWDLIQEKGFFWAFDQMIETGQIPYEEIMQSRISNRKSIKAIELGSEETGRVLGQVIETMGLAPVHLMLHDSALGMSASWVSENSGSIRSVTLVDTGASAALPLWVLEIPMIREVVQCFSFLYRKLLSSCCSKGIAFSEMEAHRILLKGRDGGRAVLGSWKKLNHSFDVAEWGGLDGIKSIPMQVIWSSDWSKEWSEEGQQVADALPQAKFILHSGERWPQEDSVDELAENIFHFVSSLPKSVRQVEEEPIPEHIQKMFDEAKSDDHHHHHHSHDHHDGHAHLHAAGYVDAYGLGGHRWGS